jgi:hypothetical protein
LKAKSRIVESLGSSILSQVDVKQIILSVKILISKELINVFFNNHSFCFELNFSIHSGKVLDLFDIHLYEL